MARKKPKIDDGLDLVPKGKSGDYVQPAIVRELKRRASDLDTSGLLRAILHHWGGPEAFARDVSLEFVAAPAGGLARQRILTLVSRLVEDATRHRPPSVDAMPDEDLEAELREIVANLEARRRAKAAADAEA